MTFKPGDPGGPGRLPKPRRTNHGGIRLTRDDLDAAKDAAHLLRLFAPGQDPDTLRRMLAGAVAIERIYTQWHARRKTFIERYDRPLSQRSKTP